jgi:hypothetical protein
LDAQANDNWFLTDEAATMLQNFNEVEQALLNVLGVPDLHTRHKKVLVQSDAMQGITEDGTEAQAYVLAGLRHSGIPSDPRFRLC